MKQIYQVLAICWDAETSYCEDYGQQDRVSWGQCAVTSLVLQDMMGGSFRRGVVEWDGRRTTHYWLVLDDGRKLDFTWDQFPPYATLRDSQTVPREKLLPPDNGWMAARYELLKERVASGLEKT